MKAELWRLLETLGYEVYEQGSFTDEKDYPQNFFTIWNDDTQGNNHYDNKENEIIWYFTIYFYSTSPLLTVEAIKQAKELLQKNKWIVPGMGHDINSASKSHSGRMIEATYIEGGIKNG